MSKFQLNPNKFRATKCIRLFLCSCGPAMLDALLGPGLGQGRRRSRGAEDPDRGTRVQSLNPGTEDSELLQTFNDTLWSDLNNAGIFDMVSKSFYPLGQIGAPGDVKFESWSSPPPNAPCWFSESGRDRETT